MPCLQQGLAQCVQLEVFRLTQADTSLIGAARLAAGMAAGAAGKAERVETSPEAPGLREKYQRWKVWLDSMLQK